MSTGVGGWAGGWFVKSDFKSPLGPSSRMRLSSRPSVAISSGRSQIDFFGVRLGKYTLVVTMLVPKYYFSSIKSL